jgi:L-malate glycosyltransferase
MMRVPHLLHAFSTFVPAGPELRAVELIRSFGDQFRHTIIALDGRTTAAANLPASRQIRVLDAPPKRGTLRTTVALCALLRAETPDLVLTYNWGAFDMLLAARLLGMPRMVHHEDGFNADEAIAFKRRRIIARRAVLGRSVRVIVPSVRLHGIATETWRLPESQVTLIPNGVPPASVGDDSAAVRRAFGIPPGVPLLGTVGHLRPEKNLIRLVELLAVLSENDAHLLVVGDGPERQRIAAAAERLEVTDRVHFAGHQTDVNRYLGAFDLFAISSDTEQMPVSLLQAMAASRPILATDVGDIRRMLPPAQAAFLAATGPACVATLAAHARRLLADPMLRRSLGVANERHVRSHYSQGQMVRAYLDTYVEVLTRSSRRPGAAA